MSAVTSLVTALSILVFGAAPIAILVVLLWLVAFFCRHPMSLAMLWLAILLYQEVFPDASLAQINGSITSLPILLLPMDIPYFFTIVYLIITAVMRSQEIVRALKENPFLSLFLVIIVSSTIMYTPLYGKMAIGEARKFYFYFFFPLLTVISIKTFRDLHRLMLGVFLVSVCILIIGCLQLLMGPPILRSTLKFTSAQGALILVFTSFSILIARANGVVIINKIIDTVMVGLFLPVGIIVHHRTVLLGAMFGLFLMVGLHRHKMLFILKVVAASIMLLTVIWVIFMNMPAFEHVFIKQLGGIIEPHSDATASWRMEGWHQQLNDLSANELLVGKGLGSYYHWFNRGTKVMTSPHNAYVQIVLKFGLLGLVVYGLLVFSFFRKVFSVRNKLPPGSMRAYIEMGLLNFGAAHAYMTG